MTAIILSFSEAQASQARIAQTRELIEVSRMIERGEVIPESLAARHDLDEIAQWLEEMKDDL
jgi:hypothetical protein